MTKTKINVFLAKKDVDVEDLVLGIADDGDPSHRRPAMATIDGVGTLYYLESKTTTPSWVKSFFGDTVNENWFKASHSSAVLIMQVRQRLMAIAFGYGRNLIDLSSVEDQFGLKVVLGAGGDAVFRKVNSTSVAGNAGKNAEQLPRLSALSEFAIDHVMDTLDKVDARVNDEVLGGAVSGGVSLSFSTEDDVRSIASRMEKVVSLYESDAYKEHYDWVDNVSPVKDKGLIVRLEEEAVARLLTGAEAIWTAPPVMIESWESIAGFSIPGLNEQKEDILVEDVLSSYKDGIQRFEQLKSKRIAVLDAADSLRPRFTWSVASCLYGELDVEDSHYCINAGKWYRIDRKYADGINDRYSKVTVYEDGPIPKYGDCQSEAAYNQLLAASNPGDMVLMDAKTITYGLGASRIELCDVLRGRDTFIHVKHYRSSSDLSHLFFQGLTSADLMKYDKEFVDKANQKIVQQGGGPNTLLCGKVSTVVYAIICQRPARIPNIPLFSRITYLETKRRLERMGIDCRICCVDGSK